MIIVIVIVIYKLFYDMDKRNKEVEREDALSHNEGSNGKKDLTGWPWFL